MADETLEYALQIGKKVRKARKKAGMSLRELASQAEVSASMVSQIENGKAYPSVRTLYNIATALAAPIDYFFPARPSQPAPQALARKEEVKVGATASDLRESFLHAGASEIQEASDADVALRAAERPRLLLKGGVTWSRLTAYTEENIEFLEVTYEPGAVSGRNMSHHNGREFGIVLEGELTLELGFETYVLSPGDTIIFYSNTPHRLQNLSEMPMRALWVIFDLDGDA